MRNFKLTPTAVMVLVTLLGYACKDNKSSNTNSKPDVEAEKLAVSVDSGTVFLNLQAVNALDTTNSQGDQSAAPGSLAIDLSAALLDSEDTMASIPTDMANIASTATSIISGPPDGFKIIIKKIVFKGDGVEEVVFKSDPGTELVIDGASVDIAALLAAAKAAGNGASSDDLGFTVSVGDYTSIELVAERRAYIKGCIKGVFENHYNETGPTDPSWTPLTDLSGEHEYCTQEAKDLYTAALPDAGNFAADLEIPDNADFEKTSSNGLTAEWMKVALNAYPSWPKTATWYDSDINEPVILAPVNETEEESIEYKIKGGFKVAKDEQLTLTMVIDMNRLLRYENGAKNHPRDFPTHKNPSFFFDSTFKANSFIFAGKPGKIYGYSIKSLVCKDDDLTISGGKLLGDPSTATCAGDGFWPVNTWMTLITNKDGKAIALKILPEDDSRLTTLTGSHYQWTDDPWIFSGSDSTKVDIRYNMDGPEDNEKFRGTIYDFPADLEAVAAGESDPFIFYWDLHDEDDTDRAGRAIYPSGTTKFPGNKDTSGVAIVWRKL